MDERAEEVMAASGLSLERVDKSKKVLVLYSSRDASGQAEWLIDVLNRRGHTVDFVDIENQPEDWNVDQGISASDKVLCVFSPEYKQAYESQLGNHQPGIMNFIASSGSLNNKIMAIVPPTGKHEKSVPAELMSFTSYGLAPRVTGHGGRGGIPAILDRIEDRQRVSAPPIGRIREMLPRRRS